MSVVGPVATRRRCPECQRTVDDATVGYCECGTELEHVSAELVERQAMAVANRFRTMKDRADYAAALERKPSAGDLYFVQGGIVVVGLGIVAAGGYVLSDWWGEGWWAVLLPAVAVALGLYFVGSGIKDLARVARAPVKALPAMVVDMDYDYVSEETVQHYLTLEDEAGEHHRFECSETQHDNAERGDIGLAYTRAGELLDFFKCGV